MARMCPQVGIPTISIVLDFLGYEGPWMPLRMHHLGGPGDLPEPTTSITGDILSFLGYESYRMKSVQKLF